MRHRPRLLIVGSGDIARRLLPLLAGRHRLFALIRDPAQAAFWRQQQVTPLLGDLDRPASLQRLSGLAEIVVHLAPPPGKDQHDPRTRHLLAALARGTPPHALIYVGTTGIYGDCAGKRIDETRTSRPQSARAQRRQDAEQQLRRFGRQSGCRVVLLRAPGIYATDRLPLERLASGQPALQPEDDIFTNHIHADDLALAVRAALQRGLPNRSINVVDDSELRMGDYLDLVADSFQLPRPPRLPASLVEQQLSPLQWSFLRESRRIGNARLKRELQCRLRYPTVADGVAHAVVQGHLESLLGL